MSFKIESKKPVLPPHQDGFAIEIEVAYDPHEEDVRKKFTIDGLEEDNLEEIIQFLDLYRNLDPTEMAKNIDFQRLFSWQDFNNNGVWPLDNLGYYNAPAAFCSYKLYHYKNGVAYSVKKVTKEMTFVEVHLEDGIFIDTIDDYVDKWHEGSSSEPLHQFLGLTETECALWVEKGNEALRELLNSQEFLKAYVSEGDSVRKFTTKFRVSKDYVFQLSERYRAGFSEEFIYSNAKREGVIIWEDRM